MYFDQGHFDIVCEWGADGITKVGTACDTIVIVDVLSFSTCVDVAVGHDAIVFPYKYKDATASDFAKSKNAILAKHRTSEGLSLSPAALMKITTGTRLVLPSQNGSVLSLLGNGKRVIAGCLRNASAIASHIQAQGGKTALIPAGERWDDNDNIRFAIEDLIGAGAIIQSLRGNKSPEAVVAEQTFLANRANLFDLLSNCSSGRELIEQNFREDVRIASELNASPAVPILHDGAYQNIKNLYAD